MPSIFHIMMWGTKMVLQKCQDVVPLLFEVVLQECHSHVLGWNTSSASGAATVPTCCTFLLFDMVLERCQDNVLDCDIIFEWCCKSAKMLIFPWCCKSARPRYFPSLCFALYFFRCSCKELQCISNVYTWDVLFATVFFLWLCVRCLLWMWLSSQSSLWKQMLRKAIQGRFKVGQQNQLPCGSCTQASTPCSWSIHLHSSCIAFLVAEQVPSWCCKISMVLRKCHHDVKLFMVLRKCHSMKMLIVCVSFYLVLSKHHTDAAK